LFLFHYSFPTDSILGCEIEAAGQQGLGQRLEVVDRSERETKRRRKKQNHKCFSVQIKIVY
jgi:hypothetical protein